MRVLLADECPMVRVGYKSILSAIEGVEIAGEATTVGEAIRLTAQLYPDFVFLDPYFSTEEPYSSQGTLASKIDICRQLKSLPRAPRVIVYANRNSPADVAAVTLADVDGYVHKGTPQEEFVSAVKQIVTGEPVWIFGLLDAQRARQRFLTALKVTSLSSREKQVLSLLLKRYRNKDIAWALRVAHQTAKNHVASVLRKLGYRSRDELYEDWEI